MARDAVARAAAGAMMRAANVAWLVLVATLVQACAPARRIAAPDAEVARLAAADADAVSGCFRCLESALQGYERVLAVRADARVGARAFRVAAQLAVRERLLGLFPAKYQDAPTRLQTHAAPDDAAAVAEVVAVVPWRRGALGQGPGMPVMRDEGARLRARRAALERRAAEDPWAAELLLALVGVQPWVALEEGQRVAGRVTPGLDPDIWWRRHPDDVALTFMRLALLRDTTIDDWRLLPSRHPGFTEADVFIGDQELARGRLVSAEEAFVRASDAFPEMLAALAFRADIRQRMEDYVTALDLYDQVLRRLPDHREALLGRVRVLGLLERHEEAVSGAEHMIALGQWYLGEASYWKAWNLYQLRRLDAARAAVDAARRLLVNADLSYLGGVIAFHQQRPEDALRDFDDAVDLEERHCEAHFDRAALHLIRRTWPAAASGFDEAYACHSARTGTFEQRIADAREARLPPRARDALVARREQALRDHHHQRAWARYNAAVAHVNLGAETLARARVDEALALGGPAADAARDLLAQLRRP